MSRLIAFGCSVTYGHGLPDCYTPPTGFRNKPSEFAWPSLLGKNLSREVVNLGSPGSGNLEILYKLLQYNFQKDDFCVVHWSFYDRIDLVRLNPDKIYRINVEDIDKEFLSEKGYITHTNIRNYMVIHHAALYLTKINVPYYFIDMNHTDNIPSFLKVKYYDTHNIYQFFTIDRALDNSHPGIESHKKFTSYLYNKIMLLRLTKDPT